jgi:hypothetical protein
MWADRAIASQYANRSMWSTCADTSVPFHQRVLFLCLDGMDECAYRLPRNTAMSKSWSTLWRPSLHNVLVITYGLTESFYLGDVNLKKDSNCQATVLCHWTGDNLLQGNCCLFSWFSLLFICKMEVAAAASPQTSF